MGAQSRDGLEAVLPEGAVAAAAPEQSLADPPTEGRRSRAARGTLVNAAFLIGLNALGLVKGFAVAGFISVAEYGVWGLVIIAFTSLYGLVQIGVNDKYIQQEAADQQQAFQLAFTLQLMLSLCFVVLIAGIMPLYALAYGTWEVLLPGWALALAMPASAFQAPLWIFYRRMDYLRQRRLQAVDPVVGIVVTLALAAAGMGYWAFVVGTIVGGWSAAAVAVRASPYRLALRYERGTLKEYATFSGPLMLQGVSVLFIAMVPVLVAQRSLGTAAVGAIAIANNISVYANKVDQVVTRTLYPAVCAVKDRRDLLQEAFLKSNRLSLLWAAPLGVGLALFAADLVHLVLGSRWSSAIPLIQAFGLMAALNQIGFNWSAFFRAIGDTKPIAVSGAVMAIGVTFFAVPLLLVGDLRGYAAGMVLANVLLVAVRMVYLRRLFPLPPIFRNVARGVWPALLALVPVLAGRLLLATGDRSDVQAAAELVLFLGVAATATLISERGLLREFRGYLRPPPVSAGRAG